ncbi:hypothetical protein ABK040_002414 [Willaertia magna]
MFHSDTIFIILSYLSSKYLFPLRLISKQWNNQITSNSVWKDLFVKDFGNPQQFLELLNEFLTNNKITIEILEIEFGNQLYFILYQIIILLIPSQKTYKQIYLEYDLENLPEKEMDELDDFLSKSDFVNENIKYMYDESGVFTKMYYYFRVYKKSLGLLITKNVTKNNVLLNNLQLFINNIHKLRSIHKLTVIFSVFEKNGLQLKLLPSSCFEITNNNSSNNNSKQSDKNKKVKLSKRQAQERKEIEMDCSFLIIGYSQQDNKIIPLSKFAYYLLCKNEKNLYKDIVNNTKICGIDSLQNITKEKSLQQVFNETEIKKDKKNKRWEREEDGDNDELKEVQSIGVSPYINGPFKPFCFYLEMDGDDSDYEEDTYEAEEEEKPIVKGSKRYEWFSSQDGWCPGFWNANFGWTFSVDFVTIWNEKFDILRVKQAQQAYIG